MQFVVVFVMDHFVQQNAPAHVSTAEDALPDDEILPSSENEEEHGAPPAAKRQNGSGSRDYGAKITVQARLRQFPAGIYEQYRANLHRVFRLHKVQHIGTMLCVRFEPCVCFAVTCVARACTALSKHRVGVEPPF